MDKREAGRALEKIFWDSPRISVNAGKAASQILAEQAIVIECEVEHERLEDQYKPIYDKDVTFIRGGVGGWPLHLNGHIGTPGKALCIVLPLGEE